MNTKYYEKNHIESKSQGVFLNEKKKNSIPLVIPVVKVEYIIIAFDVAITYMDQLTPLFLLAKSLEESTTCEKKGHN